jgi:hypothetical protein
MHATRLLARWVTASILLLTAGRATADGDEKILSFETMAGTPAAYTGARSPIRGVNGGGLPWTLREARGELRADGRVEVKVRGLVLADDPVVPPARRLTNPVATFRAKVSCLTVDAGGLASTVNVTTGDFPATPTGDAEIEAALELPVPCIAPIVFVTNTAGAWFAASGG